MDNVEISRRLYWAAFVLGTALFLLAIALGIHESIIGHHRLPPVAITYWPDIKALRDREESDHLIAQLRLALYLDLDGASNRYRIHDDLATALIARGDSGGAVAHGRKALRIDPDYVERVHTRAISFAEMGKTESAINHYRQALSLDPDFFLAHLNLGVALASWNQLDDAIKHFREARRIKTDIPEIHYNLGLALESRGDLEAAVAPYRQALQLRPDYFKAHLKLGAALAFLEHYEEAVKHYREALKLVPHYIAAQNELAQLYDTLAMTYAESGQFDTAVTTAEQAVELAIGANAHKLVDEIRQRLELYKQGKPYSEPSSE